MFTKQYLLAVAIAALTAAAPAPTSSAQITISSNTGAQTQIASDAQSTAPTLSGPRRVPTTTVSVQNSAATGTSSTPQIDFTGFYGTPACSGAMPEKITNSYTMNLTNFMMETLDNGDLMPKCFKFAEPVKAFKYSAGGKDLGLELHESDDCSWVNHGDKGYTFVSPLDTPGCVTAEEWGGKAKSFKSFRLNVIRNVGLVGQGAGVPASSAGASSAGSSAASTAVSTAVGTTAATTTGAAATQITDVQASA